MSGEQKTERFKKPTDQQLIEFAIVFNNGRLEHQKLADMLAYCKLVIDRLYDNGDIMIKGQQETEDEKTIECDQCDGCGWYEGGPFLKTTCQKCNGTGQIP